MSPPTEASRTQQAVPVFPPTTTEMGRRIRDHDWASSPLGPLDLWPQSLRSVTRLILSAQVPLVVLWGPAGIMIYNDCYARFAGQRHPTLLGQAVSRGWPEVSAFIEDVMCQVLRGQALSFRAQEMTLHRNGRPEQVWLDLDYSPVEDDTGNPAGVLTVLSDTTQQVQAERALEAQRTKLSQMFELAPGAMAMLRGPEHVYEMINPAYLELVGHRDILGKALRDALPEIAEQGFVSLLDDIYRSGKAFVGKEMDVWLNRNGERSERRLLDFVFQPVADDNGATSGIFIQGFDVTERALAARRAAFMQTLGSATANGQDAEAILANTTRLTGEHLGVAVCAYADMEPDQDGFTIRGDWSLPEAPSIVGRYHLADFGTQAVERLRAGLPLVLEDVRRELPAHEAAVYLSLGLAATLCVPYLLQGRLVALMAVHTRDPRHWDEDTVSLMQELIERSWAHIQRARSEAAVREAQRQFMATLEEQVAQRTAALAASEAQIRTIFQTSHIYQGLLSPEGNILFANATSLEGIRDELDAVVGQPLWLSPWFASTPGMPERVKQAVRRSAAGEVLDDEMTLELPVGRRVFEYSLRPVHDTEGAVVALVPEAADITARRTAEQALLQALKMEALGSLTGGIAHDFNNLLMVILSSLELMRKRMPPDRTLMRLLDSAKAGAERGAALTARLLAFARKQDLRFEHIDLQTLVSGMRELLSSSLGPGIRLRTSFTLPLPAVCTDPHQLESALLNLLVNARDAMDGTGPLLISANERWAEPGVVPLAAGRYVCLSVTDAGAGMDQTTLQRATEPFFTTKGVGKGTGLGLSMAHGLAQQSGGCLVLQSTPGEGTTATLWLPASDPAPGTAVEPVVAAPPPPLVQRSTAPQRILLVDDDELVRRNTLDMLTDKGHQVWPAASATEALGMLASTPIDLLITDHAMPHMTGSQLAASVAARYPGLPVLLMSGFADLPAPSADAPARLSKPFSQAQLLQAVDAVLGQYHQGD